MAQAQCNRGGIGGPSFAPFPQQPIPIKQWTTVVDFDGNTAQTFVHKVTAEPPDAVVTWRRRGPLGVVLREGSFQGQADFNVYPGETRVTVDLWVDDPNVAIEVTFLGSLPPVPPPSP